MREGELGRQVLEKGLNLQPFGKMLTGLSQLLHGGLLVSSCSTLGTLPHESPQLWGEESSPRPAVAQFRRKTVSVCVGVGVGGAVSQTHRWPPVSQEIPVLVWGLTLV